MLEYADVVFGLAWGDEAKGKITSELAKTGEYDMVARWAGGNNAGHTVFVNGKKYKTHLVPSGVFYGIKSVVGPACVLHPESFNAELEYLEENGFDTSLVKVSPKCHIVTDEHIEFDKARLASKLGTTAKGIAPSYAAKAGRTGLLARDILPKDMLWDGIIEGRVLCEGAQGIWLDVDHGNYPYVTSSNTLPYAASSIGFPPQKIRKIWGAAKIYDTKSGVDPLFPKSLLDDPVLSKLGELGQEYGVTTGRRRIVNWLNVDMLIEALNMSGTTHLVVSKCDILEELNKFRFHLDGRNWNFASLEDMTVSLTSAIQFNCPLVEEIHYSHSPETI